MHTEVQAHSENVPPAIVLVSIAAVFGCSLVLLVTNSSLVGDGSYYVLTAIRTGQPFPLDGRQGINLVREGPLLLGVHQGVTSTRVLTVLEGIGFLLFPALAWILAIAQTSASRVRFTLVIVSCGLCFATMIFFSVSELTLAIPLVVLASVLLTQPAPWSGPKAALAIVATLFLCFSHESLVLCAIILIGTAVIRIRARLGTIDTSASIAVLVLSVAVLGSFICTLVLWPNSNSNTFLELPASTVFLYLGGLCLIGWAVLYGRSFGLSKIRWILLVLAVASTLNGIRLGITGGPLAAYWTARCGRHIDCGAPASAPRRLDGQTQRHGSPHLVDQIVAGSGQGSHRVSPRPPDCPDRVRPTLVDRSRGLSTNSHATPRCRLFGRGTAEPGFVLPLELDQSNLEPVTPLIEQQRHRREHDDGLYSIQRRFSRAPDTARIPLE